MYDLPRIPETVKAAIKPYVMSPPEALDWLHRTVDVEEYPWEELLPPHQRKSLREMAERYIREQWHIEIPVCFLAFRLLDTEKNRRYIQAVPTDVGLKFIYILYVLPMGRFHSNCNLLSLEGNIAHGVSRYDLEHETLQLHEYISWLRFLKAGEC